MQKLASIRLAPSARVTLVAFVVSSLLPGCDARPDEVRYAQDRATALCGAMARCDQLSPLGFSSPERCEAALASDYVPCPGGIEAGPAADCVAALRTATCGDLAGGPALAACAWVCAPSIDRLQYGPE